MIQGSCCCGAVRFALLKQPEMMVTCHCTRCRKVGASTFVLVTKESFRLLSGAADVAVFEAAPPYAYNRSFCRLCGTALGEIGSGEDVFPVAANCLDTDPRIRNSFHEFVSEKPAWLEIGDDAPQYDGHPPKGDGAP